MSKIAKVLYPDGEIRYWRVIGDALLLKVIAENRRVIVLQVNGQRVPARAKLNKALSTKTVKVYEVNQTGNTTNQRNYRQRMKDKGFVEFRTFIQKEGVDDMKKQAEKWQ